MAALEHVAGSFTWLFDIIHLGDARAICFGVEDVLSLVTRRRSTGWRRTLLPREASLITAGSKMVPQEYSRERLVSVATHSLWLTEGNRSLSFLAVIDTWL